MCGIAGIWSSEPIAEPEPLAERIDHALAHRGPDGHAWSLRDDGRLLLLHRRLAIIDPSPAAGQPMSSADGRHTIIFNGEIYNHHELRDGLQRQGERFVTRSDTEVLLRLVARRGPHALARVRGMFAFALWDAHDRTLLVARDRFGIKPCYVASDGRRLGVASEIRALAAAGFGQRANAVAVLAYLRWGSIPAPLTWLHGVEAIEPGTWMQWTPRSRSCGRYVDVQRHWSGAERIARDDLRQRTREALRDAVRAHLVADVPVGLFLSGGIDSAALAATAAAERQLHAFTVVVDERTHDEASAAASVAKQFGAEHHTLRVDATRVLDHAAGFLRHIDQPTIDGMNTYLVSTAVAATGVKAVLSGIGGDEVFGGYPSFRRVVGGARLRRLPTVVRAAVGRVGSLSGSAWRRAKLQHAVDHAGSRFELYRAVRGWMMPEELERIAGPALCDQTAIAEMDEIERAFARPIDDERIEATVARLESTMYLRQQLLRDADVMSMAHGLEVRVPFVDHELVTAVWPAVSDHPDLLRRKRLLIEAVDRPLPEAVVAKPKQGFTLPFEYWIDGPLASFIRDGMESAARAGWVAESAPDAVWQAWKSRACHWSRPWGLSVLGHFLNG